jgi:hypothetical protein
MPTTLSAQHIPVTRHILLNVADYDFDGSTVDTAEAISVGGTPSGLQCTVGDVNLADPLHPVFTANAATGRWVKIKMVSQVTFDVNIYAPGVTAAGTLVQPVIGDPQPNDSRIDLVQVLGPFKD